jgi:hypothetical protein
MVGLQGVKWLHCGHVCCAKAVEGIGPLCFCAPALCACSFKGQLVGAPEFLWTKPGALGQLTQELLRADFDLEWQGRSDRLCPPVRELLETRHEDATTPLGSGICLLRFVAGANCRCPTG